jgi:hypothetical protein
MIVSKDFLDSLKDNKMSFDSITSWTFDQNIAEKFTNDIRYKVGNAEGVRILIKKKIPSGKIIMNIYGYSLFFDKSQLLSMGYDDLVIESMMKEQEVLVSGGIKISEKEIKVLP